MLEHVKHIYMFMPNNSKYIKPVLIMFSSALEQKSDAFKMFFFWEYTVFEVRSTIIK